MQTYQMVITEKLNHFKPNTFIKIIEWKPEQWALYTKTIRIVHIKNQTSAKTKKPFINQYSCNGVVMNSFLQFCLLVSLVKISQLASIRFVFVLKRFGRIFSPHRNLLVVVEPYLHLRSVEFESSTCKDHHYLE